MGRVVVRRYEPSGGDEVLNITDNNIIHVHPDGNDTVADGSIAAPYATLTAALAAVTSTKKTVVAWGRAYAEAACLSWPTVNGVELVFMNDCTISTEATEDQVIEIAPGVQTATFEATIKALGSLCVDHGNDGQDGIKIDHTDVAKKLILTLQNVYDNSYDSGDKILTVTHGGSGNAVRVYWENQGHIECEGAIYFDTQDNGDRLWLTNVWAEGGIETSTDAVSLDIRLRNGIVLHEGVTGGNAAQQIDACFCLSNNSGTLAALDTADLAGDHTEALLFPTS